MRTPQTLRFPVLLSAALFLAGSSVAHADPSITRAGECSVESGGTALAEWGGDLAAAAERGLTTAPDGYTRNAESEEAPRSLQEAADRAFSLEVPYRVQEGPTCGLYALGMVMDFFHGQDPRNETAYVVDRDATRSRAATLDPTTDRRIFETARENGYFAESLRIVNQEGGMFVADELGQLASKFGYDYRRIDDATAADVRAVVDRGHPALVGFDVDHDGNPTSVEGKRAHWGVVVGHFEYEGEEWFIAQHGWDAKRYLWRAADLEASMAQIQPTLGPKVIEVLPAN